MRALRDAGGDLLRPGANETAYYGGYERFCDRDTQAPASPTNLRATASGIDVVLTWNAATDNQADPLVELIRTAARSGQEIAGWICVVDLDRVVPIGSS